MASCIQFGEPLAPERPTLDQKSTMAPKDSSFRIGEYVNPNFTECCSFGAIFVSCVPTSIHHGAQDIFGNPTTQVEAIAGDDPMRLSCNQFKHPLN